MSDSPMLINGKPLSALRLVELKEELQRRGLPRSGNKPQLIEKLKKVRHFLYPFFPFFFLDFKLFRADVSRSHLADWRPGVAAEAQPDSCLRRRRGSAGEPQHFANHPALIGSNGLHSIG